MPRPRVDPRFRRRVAHACETCKKRKEKCNGVLPCDQCKARRVERACCYTRYPPSARSRQDGKTRGGTPGRHVQVDLIDSRDQSPAHAPLLPGQAKIDVPVVSSLPYDRDSQLPKGNRDKFIYGGESGTLALLETVRRAAYAAVGPCAFTNEQCRNPMIESNPTIRFELAVEPSIDLATAQSLAIDFSPAVSGILDLFDPPWLLDRLLDWVERPSQRSHFTSAIIYLALAVSAQGRAQSESDEQLAEQFFAFGRQLTMFNLMNDPSLETIQAVLLICYFMIAAGRHNAAFTNLGVAARAAYTLGIHLHETNTAFAGEEGLSRERAWKSLRVLDLWLAASLGRPPATSESVSNIPWVPIDPVADPKDKRPCVAEQVFSAMFRICNVFERILVEVYAEKNVSLKLAASISRQHRQWTEDLPRMLVIDRLDDSDDPKEQQSLAASPTNSGLSPKLGSGIVTMAYYYSIVLLTRPFLTFRIRHALDKESPKLDTPCSPGEAGLSTYSDACINSAINGIDAAYEYVFELDTARRQPLVVNSVFVSALCLGLALFDTSKRHEWPVSRSLVRSIDILAHLGQFNSQSARYARICRSLKEAATIYATRRDDTLLQENDQMIRSIFGDLRASSSSSGSSSRTSRSAEYNEASASNGKGTTPRSHSSLHPDEGNARPTVPFPHNFNSSHEASMPPTHGILPGQMESFPATFEHFGHNMGSVLESAARLAGHPVDSSPGYFLDQDVPLFPLTSDLSPESFFGHQDLFCLSVEDHVHHPA